MKSRLRFAGLSLSLFVSACGGTASDRGPTTPGTVSAGDTAGTDSTSLQVKTPPCADGDAAECQEKCDAGSAGACTMMGIMFRNGRGVPEAPASEIAMLERACKGGDAEGCRYLGHAYEDGKGAREDAARATDYYAKALAAHRADCEKGRAKGCYLQAFMIQLGLSVPADPAAATALQKKGLELYVRACDGGEVACCYEVAESYRIGLEVPKDAQKADALYRKACDGGNADGCFSVALSLTFDAPKDEKKAVELHKKACEMGSARSCGALGEMQAEGKGTKKDFTAALSSMAKACTGPGDARIGMSCHSAGELTLLGAGAAGKAKARAFFEKACLLGFMNGCEDARKVGGGK